MATEPMYSTASSFSLRMLNLWIGLATGVAGLPRDPA